MKFLGYILTLLHMIFGVYIFYAVAFTSKEDEKAMWRLWEVLLILYLLPRFKKELSLRYFSFQFPIICIQSLAGWLAG